MKQTPIRYCAWLYLYFLDAGNTQYIQLNENVNGEILQKAIDDHFKDCGFDGAVLSWNIMEAPDSHISCLGKH